MFFKRKKPKQNAQKEPTRPAGGDAASPHPALEPLKAAIAAQEAENPYVRAQITGKDLVTNLMDSLKDDKGVRMEALLGALGSFAGFSIVYATVKRLDEGSLKAEMPEIVVVELKDGQKFYFGDYLNRKLLQDKVCLYGLVAGKAQQLGAKTLPEVIEIIQRTVDTMGKETFAVPDLPAENRIDSTAVHFVRQGFRVYLPVLERYDLHPDDYHLACAFAIQEVLGMGREAIDLSLAVKIVMEYAIPASKLDPVTVMDAG